jgi:hypothetical protein
VRPFVRKHVLLQSARLIGHVGPAQPFLTPPPSPSCGGAAKVLQGCALHAISDPDEMNSNGISIK